MLVDQLGFAYEITYTKIIEFYVIFKFSAVYIMIFLLITNIMKNENSESCWWINWDSDMK